MNNIALKNWGLDVRPYTTKEWSVAIALGGLCFLMVFSAAALVDVLRYMAILKHKPLIQTNPHTALSWLVLFLSVTALILTFLMNKIKEKGNVYFVCVTLSLFVASILSFVFHNTAQVLTAKYYADYFDIPFGEYMNTVWIEYRFDYFVLLLLLVTTVLIRIRLKSYRLNVQRDSKDTSKKLGDAQLATSLEITKYGLRAENGTLVGKDEKGYLRAKLTDRLILAYRGGGKSSSLLIPLIIDEMHTNKLITDIKGELVAVTAKKALEAGRNVYVIDPFSVVKELGVDIKVSGFNPLAQIKLDDPLSRDRAVSAMVSALNSGSSQAESETESHFSENAQTLLEGLLDYYLDTSTTPTLPDFHDYLMDIVADREGELSDELNSGTFKSRAAYALINGTGPNERGSMKSTAYRQLQFLRSENLRNCFREDEVDIAEFVEGDCDIYVVLPEDMVKAHSRMVRLVMGLVKAKIVETSIHKIKKNYCFVLDELGQFGYCPDVEQIIATLRGRGVKVWASFQTLGQINQYKDKATFKSMPVKHFFSSDDVETLEWIQKLGGKTTVLSENVSRNMGQNARQLMKSGSESFSVSEQATDLLKFNTIRELPFDEQLVFIHGMKPIRCKKAFYFKEALYKGKFDNNPIEEKNR
ncbi:MAG: type IV secretory system conjugative DNA transfer family protein [Proteobacteria bacterium]|nr:type IV secretory system conjugative DNA transfer family protein [Pseudomonadota bacterium]